MNGCHGTMGKTITAIANEDTETIIAAGIDITDDGSSEFPVFAKIFDCNVEADVIIDFSVTEVLDDLLKYSEEKNIPIVLCTTGYSDDQLASIKKASSKLTILRSPNMSLGINILFKLVKEAAKVLAAEGFDVEVTEKHHNLKLDAPSGTALALADSVNEAMGYQYEYIMDRSERREKRGKKEIGISAVRGGTIVGDHDVMFAGIDEVVTLSHTAYSKSVFAKGAVAAAKYLAGKPAGLYTMSDVVL
jgi:4-hydroxy-tetrahydrodipicolinate reductase